MPSKAENYFEQITTDVDPVAFLRSQANGISEEEWLDFKTEPDNPKHALKIWSEAVSGFSNTAGGVFSKPAMPYVHDPYRERRGDNRRNLPQPPKPGQR